MKEKLRKSFTFLMSKCLKLRKFILVFLLIINFLIFFQKFRGNLKVLGNKHIGSDFMKGVLQRNIKDCGIACLLTIIKYYKGSNTYSNLYYLTKCDNNGISALNLINASNKLGFYSRGIKCDIDNLSNIYLPAICHVIINNYNHLDRVAGPGHPCLIFYTQ